MKFALFFIFALLILSSCATSTKEGLVLSEQRKTETLTKDFVSTKENIKDSVPLKVIEDTLLSKDVFVVNDTPVLSDTTLLTSDTVLYNPVELIREIVLLNFSYADSLLSKGFVDSAIAAVDRFAILHPLWESWKIKALQLANGSEKNSVLPYHVNLMPVKTDPYVEIPRIVLKTFAVADSLFMDKNVKSGNAILLQLVSMDSLWNSWNDSARFFIENAKILKEEKIERAHVLKLQLINENAASADYYVVQTLADSLLSLNLGDSLKIFAQKQVETAFQKGFRRASFEKEQISKDAENSGDFLRADSLGQMLILRYRAFADTLQLESWLEALHTQALLNTLNENYWQKNSPAEAFLKAENFARAGNIKKAKELYLKLSTSTERVHASQALYALSEKTCLESRKKASAIFLRAIGEHGSKKTESLQKALLELSLCLENFQDNPEAKKALKDKTAIEEEMR